MKKITQTIFFLLIILLFPLKATSFTEEIFSLNYLINNNISVIKKKLELTYLTVKLCQTQKCTKIKNFVNNKTKELLKLNNELNEINKQVSRTFDKIKKTETFIKDSADYALLKDNLKNLLKKAINLNNTIVLQITQLLKFKA